MMLPFIPQSLRASGRRAHLCAAILALTVSGTAHAQEHAATPVIQRDEVKAYRAAHEPAWREKIRNHESWLFYTDEEWPNVIQRVQELDGQGAHWREVFFEAADTIVDNEIRSFEEYYKPDDIKQEWQREVGDDLCSIAVAAKLSDDPSYREKLRELVLAVCDYPSWGQHNNDLAAGHVASGLAVAYDWHKDLFSDEEREQIRQVVSQRVPAILRALLGQMYWQNTYTWNHNQISVAGMGLAGLAFLDEIPEAGDWLAGALLDYERVGKYSSPDGSSCEGLGYWTYGRSFILKFIEGTKGVTDSGNLYELPFLRNAIRFRLASSTPGYHLVLKWADGQGYDFRGPQQILYRLAAEYRDGQGQYLADHLPFPPHHGPTSEAFAWTLLWYDPSVPETPPDFLNYRAPDWEIITSRSGWGEGDYMLSIKAGLNNDAHSHLDAGAIAFIMGQRWMLSTPGYGLGDGRPGFWDRDGGRWKFFSNSSESHSTLLINGKNQRYLPYDEAGSQVDTYLASPRTLWAEVDLNNAYDDVTNIRRTVFHRIDKYVLVLDQIDAEDIFSVEWLAQVDPYAHIRASDGELHVSDAVGSMRLTLLNPDMPFQERAPKSPYYDLKPPRLIRTYAAEAEGMSVRLAALLQPTFRDADGTPIDAELSDTDGVVHVELSGPDWQDAIWQSDDSRQLGTETVSAQARALAVFDEEDMGEGLVATGATRIVSPTLQLHSEAPVDAMVTAAPDGSALLTISKNTTVTLQLRPGLRLYRLDGEPIDTNKAVPGGEYLVAADAAALASTKAWVRSLVETARSIPGKNQ